MPTLTLERVLDAKKTIEKDFLYPFYFTNGTISNVNLDEIIIYTNAYPVEYIIQPNNDSLYSYQLIGEMSRKPTSPYRVIKFIQYRIGINSRFQFVYGDVEHNARHHVFGTADTYYNTISKITDIKELIEHPRVKIFPPSVYYANRSDIQKLYKLGFTNKN